jgi:hypothetical protein
VVIGIGFSDVGVAVNKLFFVLDLLLPIQIIGLDGLEQLEGIKYII